MKLKAVFIALFLILFYYQAFSYVVSSIKPLKLIVDQLIGENTDYIIPDNANPHTFSLRFSDIKKLKQADLVIVIGPRFENWISKFKKNNVLMLQDYLPYQVNKNPHIWTDPFYALYIYYIIKTHLIKIYPERAEKIESNYLKFINHLKNIMMNFSHQIKDIKIKGIVEVHPALYHFFKSFELEPYIFIQSGHNENISLKKIKNIRNFIKKNKIKVMITESNVTSNLVSKLIKDLKLKVVEVDILGINSDNVFDYYKSLFNKILEALK